MDARAASHTGTTAPILAAVLASCLAAASCQRSQPPATGPVAFDAPHLLSGVEVHLGDFEGDVVLLNFWASWCAPCMIEIPELMDLHARYKDRGVTVLGIAMDDRAEPARQKARDLRINYPVLRGDESIGRLFGGVHAYPTTIILDRAHRPVLRFPGLAPTRHLEREILAQLQAPG